MSSAKLISAYPPAFRDLMALAPNELPHEIRFPNEQKARAFRLLWHGFRKAVERELEKDWGENTSGLRLEWSRSAAYAARIRVDPFGGEAVLVFEPRMSDEELWNVAKTFVGKTKTAVPVMPAPVATETVTAADMGDAIMRNALASLGFSPTPHSGGGGESGGAGASGSFDAPEASDASVPAEAAPEAVDPPENNA